MTHLSQLVLDPGSRQARRDLASPYELHRTLARAFPDADGDRHRARHGVLFRVEDPVPSGVPVLVQSTTAPDWSRLPAGYAARLDGPKTVEPALHQGQRLRFRLLANPVRRTNVARPGKPDRVHRQPLVHPLPDPAAGRPDGYLAWLLRQADAHGFSLPVTVGPYGPEPLVSHVPVRTAPRRATGESTPKGKVGHFGVRFDGALSVIDPEALSASVGKGIGPAKAFGFGLLSLAPASS